jgi:hypothetical protein
MRPNFLSFSVACVPRCGYAYTNRIRRSLVDKILSLFVPSREKWFCGPLQPGLLDEGGG